VLTRQCSRCNGVGSLRIAVVADRTGIAPNWARWNATLAEEYDGAATGRAGAVGCGKTPDEAIADLLERMEP
jgi:hypothetical protein